jgi:carbonic anhydrase
MDKIIAGARRFSTEVYPRDRGFFEQLASKQQKPLALFITCSDSRVNPNLITQTEPGDLFLIRNAGNIVPPYTGSSGGEAATLEYSVDVLGIRHIIICGHSQCGAMKALLANRDLDHLPAVKAWCGHAEATRRIVEQKYRDLAPAELAVAATEENVLVQLNNLSTHPCVAARLASGEMHLYGWYYDIGGGLIRHYDQAQRRFVELREQVFAAQPLPLREPEKELV